jgi:alkyl hydroperoxide reductase subunit D
MVWQKMEDSLMSWVEQLKDSLPDYAKDIKLNLDAVINRSTIDTEHATYLSIAAAFATGNSKLLAFITASATDEVEKNAALTAGAIMAQNNVWYPYVEMADDPNLKGLPAQLRMNAITSHGGTTKGKFEAYSLASSIIGKCHFCVKAHYETLKEEGYSVEQLRDIGRIAATINALAKILSA